jgi:TRAP-type C4-dicarboxylate transport system permease small subunit
MKIFRAVVDAAARLLALTLGLALAVVVACVGLQVVMRYGFGAPPAWSEELAMLMFSWLTLGGIAYGVREGFHVAIETKNMLPRAIRRFHSGIVEVITLGFGAFVAWSGWRFMDFMWGSKSAAIRYPLEILNAMPVASGCLIVLFAAYRLLGLQAAAPAETPA